MAKSPFVLTAMLCVMFPVLGQAEGAASRDEVAAAALISRYRTEHGLGQVKPDPLLSKAAHAQAAAMAAAGVMSHSVAGDFGSRMSAMGLSRVPTAENIGAGYRSLSDLMDGWENSAGHRENLLMSRATRIGFARVEAPGKPFGVYWALVLAAPKPSSHPSRSPSSWQIRPTPLPLGIGFFIGQ